MSKLETVYDWGNQVVWTYIGHVKAGPELPLPESCYGSGRKVIDPWTNKELDYFLKAYDTAGIVDHEPRDEEGKAIERANRKDLVVITEFRKLRFEPPLPTYEEIKNAILLSELAHHSRSSS